MGLRIWAIALMEFNRLRKSWVFWCCLIIVLVVPFIVDSPSKDGQLRAAVSAAYSFGYGVSLIVSFLIPFLMTTLFFYDERTEILKVFFTQPLKPIEYAMGKFTGALLSVLLMTTVGLLVHMFFPLLLGSAPYFSVSFLTVMLVYIIPNVFYFCALSYVILILFKAPIITSILPIFYVIFSGEWTSKMDYLMRGRDLSLLRNGINSTILEISYFAQNRLLFISLGIVLLCISVLCYSPKRLLRR